MKINMRVASAFAAGALFGAVTAVQMVPNYTAAVAQRDVGDQGDPSDPFAIPSVRLRSESKVPGATDLTATLPPARADLECAAGRNGGATARGVSGTEIHLATTVAESGIGAAFLGQVRFGMEAVRSQVNSAGGICGRLLKIDYIDDGWDPQRGSQFIRNFLPEIFAIPVGPSSEGLRSEILNRDIDRSGVPVVGTDGLVIDQYTQRWVWPIAAATVASARAMADNAWQTGAKTFGIVYDKNYRFGKEAALAFNAEVKRLTGHDIDGFNSDDNCQHRYCGIQSGQSSYSNEVVEYYRTHVDFTALFLEPQTALVWMADPNTPSGNIVRYGAAQPLFTRDFAVNCQAKCDQMMVWTGFKPYIESYKNDPAVRKFVADLQRTNPQADIFNQFTEGGYLGMRLLVEALRTVGPDLTRERLRAALDNLSFSPGLAFVPRFQWRPGFRYVNTLLQGFTIQYKGSFGGWRAGPLQHDPHPTFGTA